MSVTAWHSEVVRLTDAIGRRWPHLQPDLDDVAFLAGQVAHAHPRAQAVTDPGDGMRSPNLEPGSRPIGSHSDPTATTAIAHRDNREEAAFATSASHRALVIDSLRLALSVVDASDGVDVPEERLRARDEASGVYTTNVGLPTDTKGAP